MRATQGAREFAASSRIVTVPNLLSVSRLGILVWFLVTLLAHHERILATALLAVAGSTDFFDGYVARRFNQVSSLGKVLDPAVDRVLLIAALAAMVAVAAIPVWLAAVLLCREALVALAVLSLALVRAKRIDVLFVGKAGTFGLMVGLPLLLLGSAPGQVEHVMRIIGWFVTYPSLALSLVAALAYIPQARAALAARA